jgi:hypothetical protein
MVKDILIPMRMRGLEKDHRGYPIPYGVYRDLDNRPHFTINDELTRQKILNNHLCGICGKKLERARWLIGGPLSAFTENGAFIDPPMHAECARYALQVCPYLALASYRNRIEDKTIDPTRQGPGYVTFMDPTMIDERPDPFVLIMTKKLHYIMEKTMIKYIKPKSISIVEFWSCGDRLSSHEGMVRVEKYVDIVSNKYIEAAPLK